MPAVPSCFTSIQPFNLDCRINLCKALQCMRKRHLDLSLVKGRSAHCKQAEHRSPLRHPGSASATDPSDKQQHRLCHRYRPSFSLKDLRKRQKYRLVLAQRGGKTRGAAFAHPGRTAAHRTDSRRTAASPARSRRMSPGRRHCQKGMSRPGAPRRAEGTCHPDASRGAAGCQGRGRGAGSGEGTVPRGGRLRSPAGSAPGERCPLPALLLAAGSGLSRKRLLRLAKACPQQGTSSSAIAGKSRGGQLRDGAANFAATAPEALKPEAEPGLQAGVPLGSLSSSCRIHGR